VGLVRTNVSKESVSPIIRVERIGALGTVLAVISRLNIQESGITLSHRRKNLKSYIALTGWVGSGDVMFSVRYELGLYITGHRR
jgi:hypothetical protein